MEQQGEPLNVVIPMGGIGSRFAKNGYRHPKPLINIVGRPMILWLIDNLKLTSMDTIWIGLNAGIEQEFQVSDLVRKELRERKQNIPNVKCVKLNFDTRGAAETLYIILQSMTADEKARKTISLDCDTIYFTDILSKFRALATNQSACFYFNDDQDKPVFSYISLDADNKITEIKEKVKISSNANTGAYAFASARLLERYCVKILDSGIGSSGEYYTSNVISQMITDGEHFMGIFVDSFACVGTPWQLDQFLAHVKLNPQLVKSRRFCFDLDNTLVTLPAVADDYTTVQPLYRNIKLVQELKAAGHYIIIATARRMKTHNGNVGAIIADVGMITLETLNKFNIPCDELHFGKPYAHVYVDDLAVNAIIDTERELGWSRGNQVDADLKKMNLVHPRSCNTIQVIDDVVIKSSVSDRFIGEVFYYENIPESIKHLFPKVLSVDKSDTKRMQIRVERVKGVTCSHLLTNRCLTEGRFQLVMKSLQSLHQAQDSPEQGQQVDISSNYTSKLRQRYEEHKSTYSKLGKNAKHMDYLFSSLCQYLDSYVQSGRVMRSSVIHGDPVFSNILLTNDGEVKFIDMRGLQGNTPTLQGDIMYDLAKVYQSLWGYDFVLIDKYPLESKDVESLATLRDAFRDSVTKMYKISKFRDIEMICASLLFSLIPLHDEHDHQITFMKMCESIVFPFGVDLK
ncbi:hypothetical protein MIR68_005962 [Amoeboaphelidium protococcarum]|nr:hypothetical protein MIR68_005962 [Amoeboaphelidium protococcarum]